jgi:CheY-like chemotaxis protein
MSTELAEQRCPDCSRPLQQVWDYPANELWCLHCGNRYLAAVNPSDSDSTDHLLGFRVLLLDSSTDRRDHLVRHFTRLGYQVTPVCHHRQALEAASFRRFDVIVLPASLSEIDCRGFVAKMKRLLGSVKFVLVGISETADEANLVDPDVLRANVDAADYQQLEQMMEQIIDEAAAATQAHHPRQPLVSATTSV